MSTIPTREEPTFNDYFGVCPTCGRHDGYINIGAGHWFYCAEHRTRWNVGANLFDSWKDQTEDEQRARYLELDFGSYVTVEPWRPA